MILLAAANALVLALPGANDVESALASGDFARAWELMEADPDPRSRSRWRAEILYRGGDPSGSLEAARAGLAEDADHLVLLFRAAGAALWLGDPDASTRFSARLRDAVAASESLSAGEKEAWMEQARDYVERSVRLEQHARERDLAVSRARWISAAGLGVLLALIGLGARQGRSSRPVS